jgi:RNA polymerase sigma factor (sigma-70 family)
MSQSLDTVLIARAQQGDEDAVASLYRRYAHMIARYVGYRVSDLAAVEDLTAEVFLQMVEALPRYRVTGAPFEAWLYRIASARVADYYRHRERYALVELDERLAGDRMPLELGVQQSEESAELRAALGQLSAELQGKGVQFSHRVPPPPRIKQEPPPKPVPPPYSPLRAQAHGGRKPRRWGMGRVILAPFRLIFALIRAVLLLPLYLLRSVGRTAAVVVLIALVAVATGALLMLWPQSDTEEKSAAGPEDAVWIYFEALEARRVDWLKAVICPEVFEREKFEFEHLFDDRTYRRLDLVIREVEPVNELRVRVHFFVTLEIEYQNGTVRRISNEPHDFYIERRNPQPEGSWCNTTSLLKEFS